MFKSIPEAIIKHAQETPKKLCLADDYRSVTYLEFSEQILRGASFLSFMGIRKNCKIIVESSQSIDYLAMQASIQLLGAIFVPVPSNVSTEKLQYFIDKVMPDFVFVTEYKDNLSYKKLFLIEDFVKKQFSTPLFKIREFPKPEEISEILFTTGTTGLEKGIVISYDNNVALAENVIIGANLLSDNVEFILAPFNHSHGLRRYYANMYKGGSVVMQNNVVFVKDIFTKIDVYNVNSMDMVPSALSIILKLSGDELSKYARNLRYLQFGSAPILDADKDKLRRFLPKTKLLNMYGSTESGISCISDFSIDLKKGSIGKPAVNSDILIVDENNQIINSSYKSPGRLACRSRANMLGYYGEDPSSIKHVLNEGIVFSNDIAYIDEDGDIILLGRVGDIISVGGYKFSPEDVESIALSFTGVDDCACVPVKDPIRGNIPKLYIQINQNLNKENFDLRALKKYLGENLEHYKLPLIYEFIDKIPRTYKGSLQRNLLKDI